MRTVSVDLFFPFNGSCFPVSLHALWGFFGEHRTFESNTVITLEIKVSDPLPQGLLFSCIVFVDNFCFLECGSLSVCQDQPKV